LQGPFFVRGVNGSATAESVGMADPDMSRRWKRIRGGARAVRKLAREFMLAIVVSSLMLPGLIAVATAFLFLTGPYQTDFGSSNWDGPLNRTPARSCLWGAVIGVGACLVLAMATCRRFTRAGTACTGPWDRLLQGFDQVSKRLGAVTAVPIAQPARSAYCEALRNRRRLARIFADPQQSGLSWLLATGYLNAWRRLHAIEEALLWLEAAPAVIGDALDDEMRLTGSSIPEQAALLKRLRTAVISISQSAAIYLAEPPPQRPSAKDDARAALVQVRHAIHDFRDTRREGLIRLRNRLFVTVIFAGLTGCTLLFVAILSGAQKSSILAAAAFYLVGGLIGLVKQLHAPPSAAAAAQEDFGLGVVRLIQTPLLAGLAAIGGVVLVKLTQGTGTTAGQSGLSLPDTFDLHKNPYGLVAAAFFGLAPALLLSTLQQRIDQFRTDLSKSSPADSSASADR
jgi:hypothetical protein